MRLADTEARWQVAGPREILALLEAGGGESNRASAVLERGTPVG
jgi:hypothetical protein